MITTCWSLPCRRNEETLCLLPTVQQGAPQYLWGSFTAPQAPKEPRSRLCSIAVPPPSSAVMGGCHPAAPARFWDSTHLILLIKGAERGWKYLNKEQKEQHGSLNAA